MLSPLSSPPSHLLSCHPSDHHPLIFAHLNNTIIRHLIQPLTKFEGPREKAMEVKSYSVNEAHFCIWFKSRKFFIEDVEARKKDSHFKDAS